MKMARLRDFWFHDDTVEWFEQRRKCFAILFVLAVVAAAAVLLVLRFAVKPEVKADVEDALLSRFAFVTTNTNTNTSRRFGFNASIAINVRNTNKAMRLKYSEPLVAAFLFHDRRLYNVTVAGEGHVQRPRKIELHLLQPVGEVPAGVLGGAAADELKKQNATGVFKVEVRLSGEITLGIANTRKVSLSCPLTLQLAPMDASGPGIVDFHEVNCKPVQPEKNYF